MKEELPRGTRKLVHGTKCYCGTCGAPGTWDNVLSTDGTMNEDASFEDSVFYNIYEGAIECHECWLK
jgi:hypothetical protein